LEEVAFCTGREVLLEVNGALSAAHPQGILGQQLKLHLNHLLTSYHFINGKESTVNIALGCSTYPG
jgi:hypothetical protein